MLRARIRFHTNTMSKKGRMTPTFYSAVILQKDYEAFRRLLGKQLPDTDNEWRHLHDHQIAEQRGAGLEIIEVEIYPDEFIRFCNRLKVPAEFKMLDDLASERDRLSR